MNGPRKVAVSVRAPGGGVGSGRASHWISEVRAPGPILEVIAGIAVRPTGKAATNLRRLRLARSREPPTYSATT